MSTKFIGLMYCLRSVILCLDDLSGVESELLKFPTAVFLSVSPFISTNTCLKY